MDERFAVTKKPHNLPDLTTALEPLPVVLRETVQYQWADFVTAITADGIPLPVWNDKLLSELCRAWACSEFVAQRCVRQPSLLLVQ